MHTGLVKLARQLTTSVAVALLLAGIAVAQAAVAAAERRAGALAYAPQTEALYKSDGQALYRSDSGGKDWTKVP
ncbi:MAG: hypothetical protein HC869_16585, partial [Rhodospirillales bacterium]|nr:hypothetical protein [Rhodospirillales bacterium]